ncbi:helix-turn-helix domain-containing protein [Megamonas hypermegale]|uniref:helix-turn-helix domain-containing protein n=1 Tax=Megamonas hypermegale TaxID=158847 RepID=UPI00195E567E|nr:helix-turn-helix domain-containing protein [Megamonas hypermegale]MBM6761239.1 helix-turn-helix domain-containing protein [Megamonas hypermegale]
MLGDLLRETREQKNLSLEDAEKGTNIRKLYIKAIEDGNYDKLPGEVFLKGFMKTYAKFLGLDGQKIIEQYKAEKSGVKLLPNNDEKTIEAEQSQPAEKTTVEADLKKEEKIEKQPEKTTVDKPATKPVPNIDNFNESKKYLETKNSSGSKKNVFIIVIIIILIIVGAVAFLSNQGSDSQPAADTQPTTEQTQPQQQQAQQPAPAPAPVSGSDVTATFSQDCWTEVKVDGNTVLSETVKAGSSLNWKGNNQVEVTVGNAGAVDITFNGQPQGKMGDVGAVVTKAFVAPNAQPQQPQQQQAQTPAPAQQQAAQPAPAANAQPQQAAQPQQK